MLKTPKAAPSAFAYSQAVSQRDAARGQCVRRAAEVQRMGPDARLGAAVRLLIVQLKRLRAKPCPTMKFGIEPGDVLAAVRSEVDEVEAEAVGSDAAHRELGGLLASVLHLTLVNGASVESVLVDEEHRLRLRNDEVEAGGTWVGAKARERDALAIEAELISRDGSWGPDDDRWVGVLSVAEGVRDKLAEAAQSGDTKTLSRAYNDVEDILAVMRGRS